MPVGEPSGSIGSGVPLGGDLVTGEAVVLEVRLAKLPSRMLARLIDLLVQGILLVGLILAYAAATNSGWVDETSGSALVLVLVVGVLIGYPLLLETLTRGRTVGKLALGLRVVRDDGGPIRFRHALVRALLDVVDVWLTTGALAIIASLASAQGKRVGDHLAGTVVVRERMPVHGAPMAVMPPWLSAWAATLDLSRLPDDLALAARQFLARAPDLAPQVRYSMGTRIASEVASITTPPPPLGTPAEAYLAAVVAERRQREQARYRPPENLPGAASPAPASVGIPPASVAPPPVESPPSGFAAPN